MSEEEKERIESEPAVEEHIESESEKQASGEAVSSEEKASVGPTLEEQLSEMKGNYLRSLAELENYRKRMAREMNDVKEKSRHNTISEVLGIYDLLQMAVDAASKAKDVESLKQGVEMSFGELKSIFSKLGVEVVDGSGQPFDPALHQAIGAEPSDEVPEGTVIRQWKPGFRIGDKLLRPAVVVVSSGPSAPAAPAGDGSPEAGA